MSTARQSTRRLMSELDSSSATSAQVNDCKKRKVCPQFYFASCLPNTSSSNSPPTLPPKKKLKASVTSLLFQFSTEKLPSVRKRKSKMKSKASSCSHQGFQFTVGQSSVSIPDDCNAMDDLFQLESEQISVAMPLADDALSSKGLACLPSLGASTVTFMESYIELLQKLHPNLSSFPKWKGQPYQKSILLQKLCFMGKVPPFTKLQPAQFLFPCATALKQMCPHLPELRDLSFRKRLLFEKFCATLKLITWDQITCLRAQFLLKRIAWSFQLTYGMMLPVESLPLTLLQIFGCTSVIGLPLAFLPLSTLHFHSSLVSEQFCSTSLTPRSFLFCTAETEFPSLVSQSFICCAIPTTLVQGWKQFFLSNKFICVAIQVQALCQLTKRQKLRRNKETLEIWIWNAFEFSYPGWSQCLQLHAYVNKHRGHLLRKYLLTKPLSNLPNWKLLWCNFAQERSVILGQTISPEVELQLCNNMEKAIRLLFVMPVQHLQVLLLKMNTFKPFNILNCETTIVYALLTPTRKTVYIGETGGVNNRKRRPILRFLEHVKCANKKRQNPHSKNNLYCDMKSDGPANWIMVPLCFTTPLLRLKDESVWIRKMPHTYNVHRQWKPWKTCFKETVFKIIWSNTKEMVLLAERWSESLRLQVDVPTLLTFLKKSHRLIPKQLWLKLFHRIKKKIWHTFHFQLPLSLIFKYPSGTPLLTVIKAQTYKLIYSLPLALEVRQWMSYVIRWVPQRGVQVSHVLKDNLLKLSTPELEQISRMPCQCNLFPSDFPRIQNCVIFRDPQFLEKVFTPQEVSILTQNMKNCTIGPWKQLQHAFDEFIQMIQKVATKLPWLAHYQSLLSMLRHAWWTAHNSLPDCLQLLSIRDLYLCHGNLSFQVMDKNPGKLIVLCRKLAASFHLKLLTNPLHKKLRSFPSQVESQQYLKEKLKVSMSMILNLPKGLIPNNCRGAGPYAYYLIKNKSDEMSNEIKFRTIYSYAQHPYKRCCKLIGRCLTLLVKLVAPSLPNFEMLKMEDTLIWSSSLEASILNFQNSQQIPFPGRFMELDIKDMFPSIKQKSAIQALQFVFNQWLLTRRYRTRSNVFFAVHRKYHQLDGLGKRDPKQFHVFTWQNIVDVVSWELCRNNHFQVGSTVLRQKQGVPIGGPMSAQLASLYCIACEFFKLQHSPLKSVFGPVTRFRDNILLCPTQDFSNAEIKLLFSKIYNLQFTVEQCGPGLVSLEVFLRAHYDIHKYFTHFVYHWKQITNITPKQPRLKVIQWISPLSINAQYVIKCYVPSACKKCVTYSHSRLCAIRNLVSLSHLLINNGYPPKWWRHYVLKIMHAKRTGVG